MFEVGIGAISAFAMICFTLWAMEDAGVSRGLVEAAAWVGYTGLSIGFLAAIILLFL